MTEDRKSLLLRGVLQLGGAEEQWDFLRAACPNDPALPDSLMETITQQTQPAPDAAAMWPTLSAGQVVADRFEIRGALGSGGMGVVYDAFDRKLGEPRALKFSRPGHFERLSGEARAALRITHENICRTYEVHSASTDQGPADFISMELVEGETLAGRMKRGPMSAKEVLDIMRQFCRGMDAAHRVQTLHLDLKPGNIMLARGAAPRVVIMDFGMAELLEEPGAKVAFGGTPNYIPPERWRGVRATPAADVYAMGVVLYQLLTGELPFPAGTGWVHRLTQLPVRPSRSKLAPDPRWDAIALRCLEPDPSRRTKSAGDLLVQIERTFASRTRRWLVAAAVTVAAALPVVAFRDRIWPAPAARLALLPPIGSSGNEAIDQSVRGALFDLRARLASGGPLRVLPFEDTMRNGVNSAQSAVSRLGATHVLQVTLGGRNGGFSLSADVRDARGGVSVRRFTAAFPFDHVADLATPLASVIASAFHLPASPQLKMAPEAYPAYAAGISSLNAVPPDTADAIKRFDEALAIDPNGVPALTGLSRAWLERHRTGKDAESLAEAKKAAVRAESLEPDSVDVLISLAAVAYHEGYSERSLDLFNRAAEREPANWDVWRRKGATLQQLGRTEDSLDALRRAVQLAPDYYVTHRDLGLTYLRLERAREAVEELSIVTRMVPGLGEGHLYLGTALILTEQDAEAERALRESIRLQPTRFAFNNLAVLLRVHGQNRDAITALEKALSAGPEDMGIRLNLGNALAAAGEHAAAAVQWKKARDLALAILRRNPRDATARASAGYATVLLGDAQMGADEALQGMTLAASDRVVIFWTTMALEAAKRRDEIFPLLGGATLERLRNLRRQPELSGLVKDSRFIALLQQAESQQKRK